MRQTLFDAKDIILEEYYKSTQKQYTFMSKNNPLFDVIIEDGYINCVYNIVQENKHLFPVILTKAKTDETRLHHDFNNWWQKLRRIPDSRTFAKTFYQNMGQTNRTTINELIEQSLGLSLSDQYWIKPIGSDILWEDVNFFDNEFSEDVAYLTTIGDYRANFKNMDLRSPDLTCGGMTRKQWKIIDGTRYLIKGDYIQCCREYLGYLTAKQLFIGQPTKDYVEYSIYHLERDGRLRNPVDKIYAKCKNFVTKDTEYVPFYQFRIGVATSKDKFDFDYIKRLYGDKSYVLDLQIILDYVMLNHERHFGNFGLIRDVNTGEFVGPAPIFDNGSSLLHTKYQYEEIKQLDVEKVTAKPFTKNFDEMLRFVDLSKYTEGINALQENAQSIFDEAMTESFEIHKRVLQLRKVYLDRIDEVVRLSKEIK